MQWNSGQILKSTNVKHCPVPFLRCRTFIHIVYGVKTEVEVVSVQTLDRERRGQETVERKQPRRAKLILQCDGRMGGIVVCRCNKMRCKLIQQSKISGKTWRCVGALRNDRQRIRTALSVWWIEELVPPMVLLLSDRLKTLSDKRIDLEKLNLGRLRKLQTIVVF